MAEAEAWAADCLTAILSGDAARAAAEMAAQAKRERLPAPASQRRDGTCSPRSPTAPL